MTTSIVRDIHWERKHVLRHIAEQSSTTVVAMRKRHRCLAQIDVVLVIAELIALGQVEAIMPRKGTTVERYRVRKAVL
jgi:hypothetical protein